MWECFYYSLVEVTNSPLIKTFISFLATKITINTYRKIKNREFFSAAAKTTRSFYKGGFSSKMTRREAQLILNVREGAPPEKIRDNHRKLMLVNHPDNSNYFTLLELSFCFYIKKDGSTYLATKINEAKEMLTKQ